jgi:hypothetical protein
MDPAREEISDETGGHMDVSVVEHAASRAHWLAHVNGVMQHGVMQHQRP